MQGEAILGAAAVSGGLLCLWWSVAGDRRLRGRAAENLRVGLGTDLREQVFNAEQLIAARLDQPLAGVDELISARRMLVRVDRSWCRLPPRQ